MLKHRIKKAIRKIQTFFSRVLQVITLPQCITALILLFLSVAVLIISKKTYSNDPFYLLFYQMFLPD